MNVRMTSPMPRVPQHQRGAAMMIALIMLLVLTVLGTATARMTLLEERMTGNTQDNRVAFQAAEAALRAGEDFLEQPVLPDFTGAAGLYQPAVPDQDPLWRTLDFNSPLDAVPYDGLADAAGSLSRASASYFIEELPRVPTGGVSLAADTAVDDARFYRVTARAVGIAGVAAVTLQTTYRR
jgi:type IV pilus assembly protein PilX